MTLPQIPSPSSNLPTPSSLPPQHANMPKSQNDPPAIHVFHTPESQTFKFQFSNFKFHQRPNPSLRLRSATEVYQSIIFQRQTPKDQRQTPIAYLHPGPKGNPPSIPISLLPPPISLLLPPSTLALKGTFPQFMFSILLVHKLSNFNSQISNFTKDQLPGFDSAQPPKYIK